MPSDVAAERIYVELDPEIVEDHCGAIEDENGKPLSRAVRGQLLVSPEQDAPAVFVPDELVVTVDGHEEFVPFKHKFEAFNRALAKGWLHGVPGIPSLRPKPLVARPQNRGRAPRTRTSTRRTRTAASGDDPPPGGDDDPEHDVLVQDRARERGLLRVGAGL